MAMPISMSVGDRTLHSIRCVSAGASADGYEAISDRGSPLFLKYYRDPNPLELRGEHRILSSSAFSNTPRLWTHEVLRIHGYPVLVMTRAPGSSLTAIPSFNPEDIRAIAKSLIYSLNMDRSVCNIEHNDLKRDNVFYDPTSLITTRVDFGLAESPTIPKGPSDVGTVHYRDPRIILTAPVDLKHSPDLWSIGCLLFRLVFGSHAFPFCEKLSRLGMGSDSEIMMAQFVKRLGLPPASLLGKNLGRAQRFFNMEGDTPISLRKPFTEEVKSTLPLEAMLAQKQDKFSDEEWTQLTDLLRKIFRYEDRITPEEAVHHPFLEADRMFFMAKSPPEEELFFEIRPREGDFDRPWSYPLKNRSITRPIFHLPKVDDLYRVRIVDRGGVERFSADIEIGEGDHVWVNTRGEMGVAVSSGYVLPETLLDEKEISIASKVWFVERDRKIERYKGHSVHGTPLSLSWAKEKEDKTLAKESEILGAKDLWDVPQKCALCLFEDKPLLVLTRPPGMPLSKIRLTSFSQIRPIVKTLVAALIIDRREGIEHGYLTSQDLYYHHPSRQTTRTDWRYAYNFHEERDPKRGETIANRDPRRILALPPSETESSDLWSIGCILYEMIYSSSPFTILKAKERGEATEEEALLAAIAARIGMPPSSVLSQNPEKTDAYFKKIEGAPLSFHHPLQEKLASVTSLSDRLATNPLEKEPLEDWESCRDFLLRTLRYEGRMSPQEALNHPFLKKDRMFTIASAFAREEMPTTVEIKPSRGSFSDPWTYDLKQKSVANPSLHVPLSEDDEYYVIIYGPRGEWMHSEKTRIIEGDALKLNCEGAEGAFTVMSSPPTEATAPSAREERKANGGGGGGEEVCLR